MDSEIEFRAYEYLIKMLTARGYQLITGKPNLSTVPTSFEANLSSLYQPFNLFKDSQIHNISGLWDGKHHTYVIFESTKDDSSLDGQTTIVQKFFGIKVEDLNQVHLIFVNSNADLLKDLNKKYYTKFNTDYNFETFNLKILAIAYMNHKFQNETKLLVKGSEENKILIQKYGTTMKVVFSTDPVAKFYYAQDGDIIVYDEVNYRKVKHRV